MPAGAHGRRCRLQRVPGVPVSPFFEVQGVVPFKFCHICVTFGHWLSRLILTESSLLSTGPLASFCLFTIDLMLYCMMLINACVMSCYIIIYVILMYLR